MFWRLIYDVALDALTQSMPALHGLYRAISSTPYHWTLSQWQQLTVQLKNLSSPKIIDRLNRLLIDIIQKENIDGETMSRIQTFTTRYVDQGRPLSGYFLVCCVLEMEWAVLAQTLTAPIAIRTPIAEAAAANKAWVCLTRNPALDLQIEDSEAQDSLKDIVKYAMQCFTDLSMQIEEMECEPALDTYAWETMSESLVG